MLILGINKEEALVTREAAGQVAKQVAGQVTRPRYLMFRASHGVLHHLLPCSYGINGLNRLLIYS